MIEFGEWLCGEVLKYVPHRQWVFSIPKRLRPYFMTDRKLLSELSRSAWKVLSHYLKSGVSYDDAVPGAVVAIQTFGEFQNGNPHLHVIATDGCFNNDGYFMVGTRPCAKDLEYAFRQEVFKFLKKNGKINDAVIENMMNWHHSGFNIYCGEAIWPYNQDGLENLARYIIRASFSKERMTYIPENESSDGVAKVIYRSKDGKTSKTFEAIDWLAQLTTHIPNKGEQMCRYYGHYSNKSRGMRKKEDTDHIIPQLIDSDISNRDRKRSWARLIQKIYNVNPLVCPKCKGEMKVIAFIDEDWLIRKILMHLNLWETRNHDPPKNKSPYIHELVYDDSYSQIPQYDYWTG